MNKIYKVVWSKVRNAYIVVSELAKRNSKTKSQHTSRVPHSLLRLAVVTSLSLGIASTLTFPAFATNAWGTISGTTNVAAGGGSNASGTNSVAVGNGSTASGTNAAAIAGGTAANDYSLAFGLGSIAGTAGATNNKAVAIGYNAIAYSLNDVVIGANQTAITANYGPSEDTPNGSNTSSAFGGRVLIGHDNIAYGRAGNSVILGSNNRSNAVHGIAIGQNVVVGQPDGGTLAYENAMGFGTNTRSYSTNTIAIGNNAIAGNTDTSRTSYDANGDSAVAIGAASQSTSGFTVAIGGASSATAIEAVAIGKNSNASAIYAVATGSGAQATNQGNIAVGASANASGENAMAVGRNATTAGVRASAFGYNAVASGGGAMAQGTNANASGSYSMSIGYDTVASAGSAISFGYLAKSLGTRSISIGREASAGTASTDPDAIAIGYQTVAPAGNSIAIGKTAAIDSSAASAIALGSAATAKIATSVAIGSGSTTERSTDTTSQGWNVQDSTWSSWLSTKGNAGTTSGGVWNSSAGVVSIGTDGFAGNSVTRKLTGLAAGQYDTDAVNMKQWTNTMLATTGDFQASGSTQYGSDNTPRTATKLLNESLKITGGVDNTLYYQSDFSTSPNIGSVISDNKVTLLLNKTLRGLETIYLTNPTTGNATTLSGNGITIRPSGGTAVSLTGTGLNNGGNKITNVAAGTAGTDGVNVSQLNQAIAGVSGGSGSTTTVTVEGGTAAGTDSTYTGNNLQITSTTGTNSIAYDLKLADKVTLGSTGTTGTDGSLTVNGTGGSSVAVDGATGSVALTGTDGSTATIAAGTATSDVNGTSINRITAGGATVATLDDGMVYTGDTGTAAVKLNKTVNIVGGETDSTKLSTDNNIGIVAAQDGDNGKLTVRLAKDITGLNTVTAGDAILGNQTATTAGGTSQEGSYVTGLDNTTWNVANPDIVSGRAATEDQLKTVSDAIIDGTSENATGGFGLTDDNNTAVKQDLGKTIQIAGDGNITTTADADGKKITVGLKNTVALGESGSESGSLTVNGAAGSSVAVDGATGSVALAGTDGSTATIAAGTSAPNLAGTSINRITVGGATVATLDDGMKYYGDFGSVASVKLNNQVNVKGEATTEANLTTGNIGVVSSQDGNNALLTVKLNKDLNLGSTGSLTMGNTVVNNSGITITPATGDPVSLTSSGLDNGNNKIINVAPGEISETSTDAINGSQLWKELQNISGGSGTTTSITVEGGTAAGTGGTYAGSNLQVTSTTATDGSKTYDMKLADNITLGSTGTDGVDGSVTVNGKDGSSVAVDGSTGSVTLTGNDGSTATIAAGTSAPNLAGTSINRITAGGATVATLDDGMKYGGDFGTTSSVKLNNQVNVKGEATSEADLTTGNIGVVSSQDGDNGLLTVKLNKDINLGDTGSVTTGNTVVNNDGVKVGDTALATGGLTITNGPSVTTTGIDAGSKQITNVASGSDGTDADNNPTYNTLTNGANIGDIKNITDAAKTELTNDGLNFTADSGDAVHRNLGETLNIAGDGNITTTSDATNGKITVGLSNTVSVGTTGTDGVNGTVTVNGTDGSSVAINGADGTIALNKADGSPVTIAAGTQVNNLAGTPIDRITVGGATVATMDDGMKYGGDFGTVSNVKLNNQVNVKGEATTEANLTTGNIGVVSNQDGDNGLLTVKLNKDIDLGSTGSLTTGNTVVNNDGIKITPTTGDPVSLTSSGLDNGNQKIINVAAGTADTDAVNVGQLTKAIQGVSSGEGSKTNLTVEGGTAAGTGGNYTGSNLQLTEKTETTGATTYDVKLADNITLGSAADTEAGTTGTDSSITVNGADGSAVAINGADGSIALNTADGSPVTIKAGTAADDVNGNSINRVTVGGATVATLDDGMVYTGDTGTAAVKLNKTVNIVGGETDSSKLSTDNNIGIVAEQDGDNGKLTVRLAKDITGLNTVTAGDATLGNQSTTTAGGVAQTGSYVTGLDNTTWNVSNPDIVSGRAATEDQLKTVSDALADGTSENATGGFGLADESGTTVKQDLGKTITVKGGVTDGTTTTENPTGTSNITTAVKDGALEVSLNKDIDLGSTGSVTTGNTVINNDGVTVGDTKLATDGLTITNGPSVTTEGINAGGKQITNVASGSDGVDASGNPTYNNLTNGANIGDIKNITDAAKTELTNDGLNFTADSGDTVHRNLGETLNIAGDGNITTTSDATNGKITVGLSNTVAVGTTGTDGENGTVTVNGTDGSSVAINGSNGSIVMNTGSGSPVTIQAGSSVNDVTGSPINRITVGGATVATLDDGMKYGGDFGTVSNVKLNNQVDVKGEATTEADLTTGNIGVVSSQAGDNGLLVVKLNKDLNLGSTGSVTMGNTVVNNSGVTIGSGDTAVSLTDGGLNNGGNKITNVAAGTDGTDAVNVTQLEQRIAQIAIGESKTTEITVDGGTAAPTDGTYAGSNLQVNASTTANGSPTYDIKLADNITLGSAADSTTGTTGTDSSITLNGADGSSVVVNGADGSVTTKGTDGSAVAINGSNGSIVLNTGSGSPVTIQAGTSANNLASTSVDRISVGGQTVATLSDGLKYAGDDGQTDTTKVIAKELNEQLDIVGGADATKLTDNNIGVNNVNGQLKVQLVKDIDLGDTGSVTVGTAVLGNQTVTTASGVSQTGTYLTGLSNTAWDTANPDAVSGRAATEDQLKAINDKVNAISTGTGAFGLTDDNGAAVKDSLGETIQLAGDGNITTTADADSNKLTIGLSNDISVGKSGTDGTDGKIGVNGKDGSSVVINGADGTIGLTGPAGADGTPGATITIAPGTQVNNLAGTPIDRVTVGGATVTTLDDGMKYGGDFGTVSKVKLNNQVNVKGEATTEGDLTTGNIGVVSSQEGANGLLTVKLNKDLKLGDTGSVTTGATVINNDGVTITPTTGNPVKLTGTGLDNGGNTITNVGAGTANTDAVNYGQLKAAATAVTVEGGTPAGTSDNYAGKNLQLAATTAGDKTTYDLKLADKITLGSAADSTAGTAGTDSSITVNGADGSSVAIDGSNGSITLNTADGSPVTIKAGSANDVTGTAADRITIGDQTVATLNDGMVYTGDTGSAAVKLNKTVNIVGGETDSTKLSTGNNIGIVAEQDSDNAKLTVRLAKDITGLNTVEAGDAVIGNQSVLTGDGYTESGSYVTGLENTTWDMTNPDIVSGRAATEDQLKSVSDAIIDGTGKDAIGGFGLTDDSGTAVKQDLGKTIQIAGDGNITTIADADGKKLTVGLSNDLSIGTAGTDGEDGKVAVNGKDGSGVALNGADGSIGLTGPAGADGTPGTTVTIKVADPVNDVTGTPIDRITVGGATVATLDDGMKYGGDFGSVSNVKLNNQVNVKGNAANEADLTDFNIGVVSSQTGDNGLLTVKLNKDINLGSTGSVTTGATVVNNDGVTITPSTGNPVTLTGTGLNNGGNKITNVASGTTGTTYDTSVEGQEDYNNAANIGDLTTAINDVKNAENGGGFGLTDDSGAAVKQDLGKTIQIAGDGQNITTTADATNGKITVALSNDLSIGAKDGADGTDGVDGKIGVNGKDGSAVVINGADGSIGLTGPAGADGTPGTTVTIKAGDSVNNVEGNPVDRITAGGETIATMSDGQKYAGDNAKADGTNVIAKKLNEQLDIIGGADADKLTENNIGVNNVNGQLKVQLVKDIDLGDTGSVTTGATVMNNDGITITPAAGTGTGNPVTLTGTGLNNGGNQITNVASGADGVDADGNPTYNTDTNAANIGDLKNVSDALVNKGMDFTADSGDTVHRDLGEALGIVGDGQNITTTTDPTNGNITVALSDNLSIGAKDGTNGSIGVNGSDGNVVTIDGNDGISIKGADGKDGVSITGKDGVDGVDGLEGHIGLNGKDGVTDIYTTPGEAGVNGKDGETMTRIIYTDPKGTNHQVATLDDGMKYYGDFGDVASVKLNKQVNVKGEATSEDDLTTGNIGVVSSQDGDNALLTVKLNKDINLGSNGSVTMGNTVINNSGMTITPSNGTPVSLTDAGLNNGGNKIINVAPGAINDDSTDAVNGSQLNEIRKLAGQHTYVTVEGGTEGGASEYQGKNLLLQTKRDNNLTTYYDLKLSDNITLGSANNDEGTDGVDSSITLNGADGSSVAINGADGSIALTSGANGSTATIAAGTSAPNLAGTDIDRITVGGSTVATLDDGMKYGGDFGDASKVKLNNQVNVKGNAKNEADLTDGNIGVVSSQEDENGLLTVKLNKDINLGETGSVTMGNTVVNNSGVTIGSGTSAVTLTDKGLNNGGNQITNVASGTTGNTYDTSVAGQENYNNAANIGDLTNAVNNAVENITDATKGGGFALSADDNNSVKQNLGDTIAIAGDGNTVTSVKDGKLVVGLNKDVDLGTDGSLTAGNTTINNDGVVADKIAINDSGISIDKDGINAGDKQIKNVGSGLGNTYDTTQPGQENYNNGANIGDVYAIAKSQADAEKAQSGKNITVGDDNKVNLNDNITLGSDTDASKQVNIDGNGATVTAGSGDNQVKLDGSKGQISAGGAVLGNQENTAGDKNPATGNYLTGLDNTTWDGNNIQSGRAATEDQLKTVSDKVNKGRVFQGDDGADNSVTVGLGDTLKLTGGADSNRLSDGNIGVVRNSSNDGLDIKLAKNLTNLDSVTTGNTTINNNGLTIKTVDSDRNITIEDSNINMGNNVVSGVADGTVAAGSTEAINGSQLALRDQAINSLGGTVNKLDNRINRVGAGAAALAALHPQDFDPDDKWDFAFGYGHYRGANAGAFGAFYKPNEDTTFSVGGTIGGGENMVNAGISFKVGQGNNVSNSRVGMAKEIKHLRDDVAKLEDIVNRQSQMINQLTGQNPGTIESKGNELFPDVPANHWAYEYVTKLHNLGIIEGYPDGNFDGNRMMTRYEFAAVVYRAIMAGAASNAALQGDDTLDRLANEFSAELKYIRIDTIAKDKDGKPTIQRVRIVPENKQN